MVMIWPPCTYVEGHPGAFECERNNVHNIYAVVMQNVLPHLCSRCSVMLAACCMRSMRHPGPP